ncbi:MAG: hypothetical protein R3345_09315 [Fulvivirga sp.]|nr:hypothetical protein [Fulvivirga sp.]
MTAYNVHINRIHCYRQDESDGDELFLKYKGERIWPLHHKYKKVKEGEEEVNIDIAGISPGEIIEIELWDYDILSSNDKLGTFKMLIDEQGGPFSTDLSGNNTMMKYTLDWEVE